MHTITALSDTQFRNHSGTNLGAGSYNNGTKTVSFKGMNGSLQFTLTQLLEQLALPSHINWQVRFDEPTDIAFVDLETDTGAAYLSQLDDVKYVIEIGNKPCSDAQHYHLNKPIRAREFINCLNEIFLKKLSTEKSNNN